MASPVHNGNRFRLSTGKNMALLSHALCHWQCGMLDHDEDEEGPIEPDHSLGLRPTRNYSVYTQMGLSAKNADGHRRLRVSLWSSMSAETDGTETSLGAAIDTDHEVELQLGVPVFLKFRSVDYPLRNADDDGDDPAAGESFPGALLIATMITDMEVHVHWALAFPVLVVRWDSLFERAVVNAKTLPGVPTPPPVRETQRTMDEMLQEAQAKRKRKASNAGVE